MNRRAKFGFLSSLLLATAAAPALADVLLDQTNLIAAPGVAPSSQYSFTTTSSQALTVTLTDALEPAAFQALQIAVVLNNAVVAQGSVDSTTHTIAVQVPGAAGAYTLYVIGTPSGQGFGSFSVCTAPQTTPSACIAADSYSDNIVTPSAGTNALTSTLQTSFMSTTAGTYTVTLTDDAFPKALQSAFAGITLGNASIAGPIAPGVPTTVTLSAATSYSLLVAATADATAKAGLYGIQITDPSGAVIVGRSVPVGSLGTGIVATNSAAQPLTLALSDQDYPAALASVGVAVTAGAKSLAVLTAPGAVNDFPAPSGQLEIWQYAVAGAQPGVYALGLTGGGGKLYSTTAVINPGTGAASTAFAFLAPIPAAGTYVAAVNDFQFPVTLQTLNFTVAQSGLPLTVGASGSFTAAAGNVIVVVNAAAAANTSGVFGVTVATSGASPTYLLDTTQAVGAEYQESVVKVSAAGSYDVTLKDLGFPGTFQDLAVVLSAAGKSVGSIFNVGTFSVSVTPGNYVLTTVATPNSALNYGLYTVQMASAPPTVTFSASPTTVVTGQPTQLTWSSTNATSCMASGAPNWTGNQPVSGTDALTINATATLNLTCTGPGGSTPQTVMITATTASSSSSGGGDLDLATVLGLGGLLALRALRMRSRDAAART